MRNNLASHQRGIVLLLMLTMIIAAAATFLLTTVNPEQRKRQQQQTMNQAMISARDALIGDALINADAFICPDTTDDGNADGTRMSCDGLGRLPYRSLGIENWQDDGGSLWYVLRQTGGLQLMSSGSYKTIIIAGNARLAVNGTDPLQPNYALELENLQNIDLDNDYAFATEITQHLNSDPQADIVFNDSALVVQ